MRTDGREGAGRETRRQNWYSDRSFDRLTHRRKDAAWLARALEKDSTLFVPVRGTRNVIQDGEEPVPVFLDRGQLLEIAPAGVPTVFLGQSGEKVFFGCDVSEIPEEVLERFGQLRELRGVGALLPRADAALLAYARAMVFWNRRNLFCGSCGRPARSDSGGHVRVCTDAACAQQHFPRIDPAVIVLVAAEDCCLLGRQAIWPPTRYSVIAGFVEPGETLEGAVAREVFEETSIHVCSVRYHSSQPWPFPASIMLGFVAEAPREVVRARDGELEDARWFSRSELEQAVRDGSVTLPPRDSIACRLIEDWFDAGGETKLRDLPSVSWWAAGR